MASLIYQRHVMFEFPIPVIAARMRGLPELKEGYEMRMPRDEADYVALARLLNEEPGFGIWTPERVRTELMARVLDDPRAANLILYMGEPVACGFVIDASTNRRRIAHGMYLYIAPAHRGRSSLAYLCAYRTLGVCVERGYDRVIAVTDPARLPALQLYLSSGCIPVHGSLFSYVQWHRIRRHLRPTLTVAQRRARRLGERGAALSGRGDP